MSPECLDGLTLEQAALIAASLSEFSDFKELQGALNFLKGTEDIDDGLDDLELRLKRGIAECNLKLIQQELSRPEGLRRFIKYDNASGLLDRKAFMEWLNDYGFNYRRVFESEEIKHDQIRHEQPLSNWNIKSALATEEASLIITGLPLFTSFTEAKEYIKQEDILFAKQTELDDLISQYDVHDDSSGWAEVRDQTNYIPPELTTKGLHEYKTRLENAYAVEKTIAFELSLDDISTSLLKPATHDKTLITKESIHSWCISQGIDLQYWHRVFPSNNEHNEPENLLSNGAEANDENPQTKPENQLIINPNQRPNELRKIMVREMKSGFDEYGEPPTETELFNRIVSNQSYGYDYCPTSGDLKPTTGKPIKRRRFKENYKTYFTSRDKAE